MSGRKKMSQTRGKEHEQPSGKKAALYVRVSTDAQREEGYSIEAQQERLKAYCLSKGISSYEFYIDGGYSGSSLDRPEIRRLIEDAGQKKFDYVVVYKLDRISRSQKDTLYLIEDVFLPYDIGFVSINESFDTSTPFGRAMVGILSVFAQLERENIFDRTRMGMQKRVEEGYWMGGGKIPFGYDYDRSKGILVPNEDAQKVKQIYKLYLKGYSPQKIALMLGLKYDKLVMQILQRKSNTGVIVYNGTEYQGRHEPIIDLDTYQRAADLMKERAAIKTASSEHLLTGLVFCGKCGAKMRYQKWGKAGYKFVCYSQQSSKPYLVKDPYCDNQRVWADEVEQAVTEGLFKLSWGGLAEVQGEEEAVPALQLLRGQYRQVAERIKRLYRLYAESEEALLLETIEESKEELEHLQEQIEMEEKRGYISQNIDRVKKDLKGIESGWQLMSVMEKQKIVRECIDRIILTDNQIDIKMKLIGAS